MSDPFALWLPDTGPDTRLLVTYERAGNRCVLPCRYVDRRADGALVVEVEQVDTRTGVLVARPTRVILAEELRAVEPALPAAPEDPRPDLDTLQDWMSQGGCEATDGCWVEPDGECEHGARSWLWELELL